LGQGRLASYGLPLIGEGPGAKLEAASPRCAIARTASDPVLRTVQGGTAGRSCEEETVTFLPTVPGRWVMVRRDSARSRSVVLAALRALHLDGAFAAGGLLRYREGRDGAVMPSIYRTQRAGS